MMLTDNGQLAGLYDADRPEACRIDQNRVLNETVRLINRSICRLVSDRVNNSQNGLENKDSFELISVLHNF